MKDPFDFRSAEKDAFDCRTYVPSILREANSRPAPQGKVTVVLPVFNGPCLARLWDAASRPGGWHPGSVGRYPFNYPLAGTFARATRADRDCAQYTPRSRFGAPNDPRPAEIAHDHVFLPPACARAPAIASARPWPSLAVAATLLAGCGDKKKDKPATQTAAKVNKEEITVHQINFLMASSGRCRPSRPLRPAARCWNASSTRSWPCRRRPTRSSTATRAWSSRSRRRGARSSPVPTSRRSAKARPSRRRPRSTPTTRRIRRCSRSAGSTTSRKLDIEAKPDQIDALKKAACRREDLRRVRRLPEGQQLPSYQGNEVVRAAEQLPLASVDQFAKMKDGQTIFNARPGRGPGDQPGGFAQPAGRAGPGDAGDRAVPAQRAQAQARRRRSASAARRRQDRICRRLRGRTPPLAATGAVSTGAAAADVDARRRLPASAVDAAPQVEWRRSVTPGRRRCRAARRSTRSKGFK